MGNQKWINFEAQNTVKTNEGSDHLSEIETTLRDIATKTLRDDTDKQNEHDAKPIEPSNIKQNLEQAIKKTEERINSEENNLRLLKKRLRNIEENDVQLSSRRRTAKKPRHTPLPHADVSTAPITSIEGNKPDEMNSVFEAAIFPLNIESTLVQSEKTFQLPDNFKVVLEQMLDQLEDKDFLLSPIMTPSGKYTVLYHTHPAFRIDSAGCITTDKNYLKLKAEGINPQKIATTMVEAFKAEGHPRGSPMTITGRDKELCEALEEIGTHQGFNAKWVDRPKTETNIEEQTNRKPRNAKDHILSNL